VIAGATFLLIIAGALVTSNDAGLSVPDWPTSFHHSPISYAYFQVPLVGGVLYEHGHRIIAELIGFLTVVLAIWTWRTDHRPWMRKLGLAALGAVILQGMLGGITVLTGLPPVVSSAHAALGQAFFCIAVAISLFTGRRWVSDEPGTSLSIPSSQHVGGEPQADNQALKTAPPGSSLPILAWFAVSAIYVQLFLGAMFRHHGMRLLPHLVMAAVVTLVVVRTAFRTLSHYRHIEQLRRPATALLGLLLAQLTLGFLAYLTRVMWSSNGEQPGVAMVMATVTHVAVGALLLATAVVLAIQVSRHVKVPQLEPVPPNQKAITA
jgi:cytochrome c oxidase assembly protein subunit 15